MNLANYGAFGDGTEGLEVMDNAPKYNDAIEALIIEAIGPASSKARVLDVGAGSGEYSKRLNSLGYSVTCIEPNPLQAERLRAEGFEVYSDIHDVDAKIVFSSAYMVNVLEHVEDDIGILRQIRERLADKGVIFVWVPAFECLYSDFDYSLGHYRRYRRANLERALVLAGFDVRGSCYRDSVGWFAALGWKYFPRRTDSMVSGRAVALYDKVFFPISRSCDRICAPIVGKNVVAVGTCSGKISDNAQSE